MKTELEQIKSEFNERIDALLKKYVEPSKTGFEVGKWYKFICKTNFLKFYILKFDRYENGKIYYSIMINHDSEYRTNDWLDSTNILTSLTESEVKEVLIKEAEKKYGIIKDGTRFTLEGAYQNCEIWILAYYKNSWKYSSEYDTLSLMGFLIYKQGKWATIVKEEEIKIGGYEVKFSGIGKCSILIPQTHIDGNKFTKEFWEAALKISEHSKAAVWVGCDSKNPCVTSSNKWPVSRETINKILNKLRLNTLQTLSH